MIKRILRQTLSLFEKKKPIITKIEADGFTIFGDEFHQGGMRNIVTLDNNFNIIKKYLSKNPVIIDIGAYIGGNSIKYSTASGSTIYSIEPIKSSYDLILKNIKYNKISNIKVFNLGISDKNGKAFFGNTTKKQQDYRYDSQESNDKALSSIYGVNGEECEIITLDDFVLKNNIKKIDFIKIDTEGHDLFVLKGGEKTIKKFKPIIQAEAIDYIIKNAGLKIEDLIEYIRRLGIYDIYYFTKHAESIAKIEGRNYPNAMNLLLIPKNK